MPTAIVISEGQADDAFLKKLIEARQIANLEVVPAVKPESYGHGGFQRRLEGLKIRGVEQNKAIIIVADNDEYPDRAFSNIQVQIRDAGDYNVPRNPYELSARGKLPPIAVVMLPSGGQQGSLDSVCLSAVDAKYDRQLQCVNAIVKCIGATEETWGKVQLAKLKIQCLLSVICSGDPYTPLKCAWLVEARKGRTGDIFPLNNAAFDSIADFLRAVGEI